VFSFRDDQALELEKMVNQLHFRRGLDGPEYDGATFCFQDGKGAAVAKAVLVPDVLRDHNLPLLRHVDYCHGRKLLLTVALRKPNFPCAPQFLMPKPARKMVVPRSGGLHVGVTDRGTHKFKTALFQIFI
jgi:hypothetical protein